MREDETDEKNEIPCSGPEQDTPNRSILGRLFLHVILTMLLVRIPAPREKGTIRTFGSQSAYAGQSRYT